MNPHGIGRSAGPDDALPLLAGDAERGVFRLVDPTGSTVRYDPAVVSRRIRGAEVETGRRYQEIHEVLAAPAPEADRCDALRDLARLAYAAFGRSPIEEDQRGGWTEGEAIECLYQFIRWSVELAESRRGPEGGLASPAA